MSEQGYRNIYVRTSELLRTQGYVVVSHDWNDIPKGCDCSQGDIELLWDNPPEWMANKFILKKGKKVKAGTVYELVRK